MYIGTGIFLIVVGAILAFALTDQQIGPLQVQVVGYICLIAGVLSIVLSFVMGGGGYRSRRVTQTDPQTGTRVDETRMDGGNF